MDEVIIEKGGIALSDAELGEFLAHQFPLMAKGMDETRFIYFMEYFRRDCHIGYPKDKIIEK